MPAAFLQDLLCPHLCRLQTGTVGGFSSESFLRVLLLEFPCQAQSVPASFTTAVFLQALLSTPACRLWTGNCGGFATERKSSCGVLFACLVAAAGYRLPQTRNDTWRRVHSHFSTRQTSWIETKSLANIGENILHTRQNYWSKLLTRNDTWRRVHSHFSTKQTMQIETKSSAKLANIGRQRCTTRTAKITVCNKETRSASAES